LTIENAHAPIPRVNPPAPTAEASSPTSDRAAVSQLIAARLERDAAELRRRWQAATPFHHFVVDDLLPVELARRIGAAFPPPASLLLRSTLRERKRVGIQVDAYAPIIADALFAFQDPAVVAAVTQITGLRAMTADPTLYASGISVMDRGDFLNPHLDNSHDGDRRLYRVLNLLYYVSPDWTLSNGGNLELWDHHVRTPTLIESRFNRLAIIETHRQSWHSVNAVRVDGTRRCVSNYYFSPDPPTGRAYRHVTTFIGRPEEPLKRLVLGVTDGLLLNAVGRAFPWLTQLSRHRLKRPPRA
jgi:Rps23 Pro-64 3,4-dihydroxylase Tpa1-like proline 4-hydroxylase